MREQPQNSLIPRLFWMTAHLIVVLCAAWVLFGGGLHIVGTWFDQSWTPGDTLRRSLLLIFGVIMWSRMALTAFVFLKRPFVWGEAIAVTVAVAVYQLGYALLGGGQPSPFDWLDGVALFLFVLGSVLNTGGEWQRKRFKENPANRGKLFTQGFFRLSQHINYFGDILWVCGWALLTRNFWAVLIPLLLLCGFIFLLIPSLDAHLKEHYGKQYDAWASKTKKLIPFLY